MNGALQRSRAEAFHALHRAPPILVLPNAWDAASARIFEAAGFPALATTSAGVAAAVGFPDGERTPRDEMVQAVARIARSVSVPVTADMEGGYGRRPEDVAETVGAVLEAGAVGVNLEDGRDDPSRPLREVDEIVERLHAAREAAERAGVPVVINARTDVLLRGVGEEGGRLDHAIRRAAAYRRAGADCLFVPGARDAGVIGVLAREIDGPLNVLAIAGVPPVRELEALGVARVSMGSGPMRAALTVALRIAEELRRDGTYTSFASGALTHAEVNALMDRRAAGSPSG